LIDSALTQSGLPHCYIYFISPQLSERLQ